MLLRIAVLLAAGIALVACGGEDVAETSDGYRMRGGTFEDLGVESREEAIMTSDVIVRARLTSTEEGVEAWTPFDGTARYSPALIFTFAVQEYLKGYGANTITVVATGDKWWYETRAAAETASEGIVAEHDSQWDNREAILFLMRDPAIPSTMTGDRYFIGERDWMIESGDNYSLHTRWERNWLPAASAGSGASGRAAGGASGASSSDTAYLLEAPAASSSSSRSSFQSGPATVTLSDLKSTIASITAWVAEGGDSEEYERCVRRTYTVARIQRHEESIGRPYQEISREADSGAITSVKSGLYFADPPASWEHWTAGPDAALFTVVRASDSWLVYETTRPLPAGQYRFFPAAHYGLLALCQTRTTAKYDPEHGLEYVVDVKAPVGTAYEAMFDTATVNGAVQASNMLKPYTAAGSDTSSTTSVSWRSGTLKIGMDPVTAHAGRYIDFIDVDGELALPLKLSEATMDATAKTLSWIVADAPWEAGDKMMLRIYEKVASTCTVAEGAMMPGACYADLAFTGAPYSFTVYDVVAGSSVGSVSVNFPDPD